MIRGQTVESQSADNQYNQNIGTDDRVTNGNQTQALRSFQVGTPNMASPVGR